MTIHDVYITTLLSIYETITRIFNNFWLPLMTLTFNFCCYTRTHVTVVTWQKKADLPELKITKKSLGKTQQQQQQPVC